MALSQLIELDTGVSVVYHKIVDIQVDYTFGGIRGIIGSFISVAAAEQGLMPIKLTTFEFKVIPISGEDPRVEAYNNIKIHVLTSAVDA